MTDTNIIDSEKKEEIFTLYKNNDICNLKKYIRDNNISLKEFNRELHKEKIDILIHAIENDASYEMINFLIKHCKYETLNYTFNDNKENYGHYETFHGTFGGYSDYKTPLFSAVIKNNFKIANLLIENKADINYFTHFENIVDFMYNLNLLNNKNLRYILNKGVHAEYFLIHMQLFINDFKNDFLEIIFKHYIFDNNFILNFLNLSNVQKPLSNQQLQHIIRKEKNKLYIHEFAYKNAIENENFDAIMILLDNDGSELDVLLEIISNYKILEKATEKKAIKLVRKILSFKTIYL
ncbi:hypothetical protein PIROE2DRAFT_58981 [Piromyces sp. E2]|nr:hypothetical protein PIROE2DRAFT_58981 [Piromyces sp. E2]|eukprot:OUM67081.1 hypothetical protein PIROE2DRAFT_58981 [Piromyces sp. E2]